MAFEYQLICDALNGAEIEFDMNDICNVEMDADYLNFSIKGASDAYFIRLWDMQDWDNKVVIEYSLYRANVMNAADLLFDSIFIAQR